MKCTQLINEFDSYLAEVKTGSETVSIRLENLHNGS